MKDQHLVTSLLHESLKKVEAPNVSFNYLIHLFPDIGLILTIFLLSLVASLPIPMFGFSTILGLMIVLFSLQLCFNLDPYLPKFIAKKKISKNFLITVVAKSENYERKLKIYIRPRLEFLFLRKGLKIIFIYVAILGFLISIPIPIPASNVIFALPVAIISLACLHRDGLLLMLGFIASLVGIVGFWSLICFVFI